MQVTAEFVDGARRLTQDEKAGALQRLARALDKAPEDVRGVHVLLGEGYGMDAQGRIRLQHTDDAPLWIG